jgi:hypothetical protein
MAKQSFSVGQVLTANQMLSLQQTAMLGGSATAKTASYTLVAADAGTVVSVNSTSATTITVNTGLFSAGDTVTIQNWGSGLVTITAGTATVNTAGSLIVPQYDGGVLYFTNASAAIYFDFVQAGAVSPLTTKGDLYTFGSSDTRLGVGANGTTLVADSAETTGLKWATPASGGMTLIQETTASGLSSLSFTSIPATYKELYLVWEGIVHSTTGSSFDVRLNNDSTVNNYAYALWAVKDGSTAESANAQGESIAAGGRFASFGIDTTSASLQQNNSGWLRIDNYASTTKYKAVKGNWINYDNSGTTGINGCSCFSIWKSTSAITSIDIARIAGAATFSNATNTSIRLYGLS